MAQGQNEEQSRPETLSHEVAYRLNTWIGKIVNTLERVERIAAEDGYHESHRIVECQRWLQEMAAYIEVHAKEEPQS